MPNPRKPLSFNDWIAADYVVGPKWERRRGRLTRESVERRFQEIGMSPGTGYGSWDAYTSSLLAPTPST